MMLNRPPNIANFVGILRYIWTNPSNQGRQMRHLALMIAWQAYKRTVGLPIVINLDNRRRYIAYPRAGNAVGAIYCRVYEAEYVLFARKHIVRRESGTLLDVGAHTGLFTLLLADCFHSAACFEPAPDTFEILEDNLRLNRLSTFEAVQCAASSESGTVSFEIVGQYSGVNRVSLNGESGTIVRSVSLDDYCRARNIMNDITFLKIDTEGHEVEVLAGAAELMGANSDLLVLAENGDFDRLQEVFMRHQMKVFGVSRNGDIIFPPRRDGYNIFACGPTHPLHRQLSQIPTKSESASESEP